MSRRLIAIIIAVVAAMVSVALILRIVDSEIDNCHRDKGETSDEYNGLIAEYNGEDIYEVLVDFGDVTPSSTVVKNIRIVNRCTTPLILLDHTTQCRCMWLEYSREPITEGTYTDVELTFDSRGEWGTVGNYMEITTSSGRPIVLWIGAEIE
jgi:hypothetical protein